MTKALALGSYPPAAEEKAWQILQQMPAQDFYLAQNPQGLWQLCREGIKPLHIDFSGAHYRHRGGTEYLPKAFKGMAGGSIIDATAGWGRDAWLLAYRGFRLTLCERNPYLYILLKQAVEQARELPLTAAVAARIEIVHHDSRDFLTASGAQADAIYLDPMYPQRQKSAKVKKDMQILHALLGADAGEQSDNAQLLDSALNSGCPRIVVKRPHSAEHLGGIAPHHSIEAPNTRFDIYLSRI